MINNNNLRTVMNLNKFNKILKLKIPKTYNLNKNNRIKILSNKYNKLPKLILF